MPPIPFSLMERELYFSSIASLALIDNQLPEKERAILADLSKELELSGEFTSQRILSPLPISELKEEVKKIANPILKMAIIEGLIATAFADEKYDNKEKEFVREIAKSLRVGENYLLRVESCCENSGMKNLVVPVAIGVLACAAAIVAAPLAAPAIGGAIGGAMGLSGAAASSAGLAALGGGSLASGGAGMAGGTMLIQGVLASITGAKSVRVISSYSGGLKDFGVLSIKEGSGETVAVTVSGFLTKGQINSKKWENIVDNFPESSIREVSWDSKNLTALGKLLLDPASGASAGLAILGKTATKVAAHTVAMAALPYGVLHIAGNPWSVALKNSKKAGIQLAEWMLNTSKMENIVLFGHSLGARVIQNALLALPPGAKVRDVYLFGGAVGNDEEAWSIASESVRGKIFNYYTPNDKILSQLFKLAVVGRETAIGIAPIEGHDRINNIDVSGLVEDHAGYFKNIKSIERA